MKISVISTSLSQESKSFKLAQQAIACLQALEVDCELIDLRDYPLPMCDAGNAYSDSNVATLKQKIDSANALLVAAPVYNYALNSASKNLIELTSVAWESKPVGFMVAAGGKSSYMAPLSAANSLMVDLRCPIIPRFVYADPAMFLDNGIDPQIIKRIKELVEVTAHWAKVL